MRLLAVELLIRGIHRRAGAENPGRRAHRHAGDRGQPGLVQRLPRLGVADAEIGDLQGSVPIEHVGRLHVAVDHGPRLSVHLDAVVAELERLRQRGDHLHRPGRADGRVILPRSDGLAQVAARDVLVLQPGRLVVEMGVEQFHDVGMVHQLVLDQLDHLALVLEKVPLRLRVEAELDHPDVFRRGSWRGHPDLAEAADRQPFDQFPLRGAGRPVAHREPGEARRDHAEDAPAAIGR